MNHHQNHHLKANVHLDDEIVKKVAFMILLEMIRYQYLSEQKKMTMMVQGNVAKVKVQQSESIYNLGIQV